MAVALTNPVAYGMAYSAQDLSKATRSAVSTVEVFNGMLVTLDGFATAENGGQGYVFAATPTTANTAVDVWMVRSPEVPKDVCSNLYVDPRAFSIPAGQVFDVIHLDPNDIIKVSDANFGSNTKPATGTSFVTAAANGEYNSQAAGTGVTGIVFKFLGNESFAIGQEFINGYILEVVQNPNQALA